ncbi:MAG: hypothetical protein ACHREM_24420 [Polyangiales bacterium]
MSQAHFIVPASFDELGNACALLRIPDVVPFFSLTRLVIVANYPPLPHTKHVARRCRAARDKRRAGRRNLVLLVGVSAGTDEMLMGPVDARMFLPTSFGARLSAPGLAPSQCLEVRLRRAGIRGPSSVMVALFGDVPDPPRVFVEKTCTACGAFGRMDEQLDECDVCLAKRWAEEDAEDEDHEDEDDDDEEQEGP